MRIKLCCQHDKYNELLSLIERNLNRETFKVTKMQYNGPMAGAYDQNVSVDVWFKLRDKQETMMWTSTFQTLLTVLQSPPVSFFYTYI